MSVAASNPVQYRSNLSASGVNNINSNVQPLQLPKIVHSQSRIGDPNSINVTARGVSRASSLGDMVDKITDENNSGRPLPYEFGEDSMYLRKKDKLVQRITNGLHKSLQNVQKNDANYSIPENIKAVYSPDIGKPAMPVFGSRPDSLMSNGRGGGGRAVPATPIFQKAEIEEIYQLLKERVRTSYHEIKTKFKNADHDGKGMVSKDAFAHIIAAILGPSKPLSHQQFQKLLERLDLKNKPIVKLEDFIGCFQEARVESQGWIDPVRTQMVSQAGQPLGTITRKATQVYVIIKEKCKLKAKEMIDLIPQLNGGNPNRIFKPELLNTINLINIKMEPEEFDKLWKKFDEENLGVIHSDAFLKKLGLTEFISNGPRSDVGGRKQPNEVHVSNENSHSALDVPLPNVSNDLSSQKLKSGSRASSKNPIERWLKRRFREGFTQMKFAFEKLDPTKTGEVRKEQFLAVLRKFGLKLETHLLDAFLDRCEIELKGSNLVPYSKFLEKFQNRSEQGLTYKVITNNADTYRPESAIGQIEKKLLRMFQRDFLSLLSIFRKIDRNKTNALSKQEFRAALESHFSVEMTDDEFEEFIKDLPTEDGKIRYLEFMARFDTDDTNSLFDSQSFIGDIGAPAKRNWDAIEEENEEEGGLSPRDNDNYNPATGRNLRDLHEVLKNYIRNSYKDLETKWSNIDMSNTGEMNKDTLYQLLKSLKINPQITRSEIDALWKQFILKDNNKLEYWQFIRHFGYTKKSAAFQNAKKAPPKKGDSDMMLTSNKLGRDSILIRGSVHAKLRLESENLRRKFNEMDPYRSGYVLRDEYREILTELCPELNDDEFEVLVEKYENPFDGRINYNLFLQPYTVRIRLAARLTNQSPRSDSTDPLVQKLKYKLSDRFKELRRLFKQKDYKQTGTISVNAFKECLDATKINLNDEEMYNLLNRLDKDMLGSINYNNFLNDFIIVKH